MTPIPQSTCDRAELLSRSHELQEVAAILKLQPSQISRMRKRGWKAADYSSRRTPMPSDFAIQQGCMTWAELIAHYRVGNSTLKRWFELLPKGSRRASLRGANLRKDRTGQLQQSRRAG